MTILKNMNRVNVIDFGAKADGSANDASAIQKAIDYAESKGQEVYIPNGTYLLNAGIALGSNAVLRMDPNANLIRNFVGTGSTMATIRNKVQSSNGNTNIKIFGGTIRTNDPVNIGKHISLWGVFGLQIVGTKVEGCYSDWAITLREVMNAQLNDIKVDVIGDLIYTDGIHITGGCKDIQISDSNILSADDAISITSELDIDKTISNINISNCSLNTKRASAIKIMMSRPLWVKNTAYKLDDQIIVQRQDGTGMIYVCRVAGTTGTVAPSHTSGRATDGTVTWETYQTADKVNASPNDSKIINVNFTNIVGKSGTLDQGQPIVIEDRSRMKRIQNISLNNVSLDASQSAGFGMQATGLYNFSVTDTTITNSDGTSFLVENSDLVVLRGIKAIKPRAVSANGITIRAITGFEISGAMIDLNTSSSGNAIRVGTALTYSTHTAESGTVSNCFARTYNGWSIYLDGAQGVSVVNNSIISPSQGILEETTSGYNRIEGNDVRKVLTKKIFRNNATGTTSLADTTVVHGNPGYISENRGTFWLKAGQTTMDVPHGLPGSPSVSSIRTTYRTNPGNVTKCWVDNLLDDTFTFNASPAPTADIQISFECGLSKNI